MLGDRGFNLNETTQSGIAKQDRQKMESVIAYLQVFGLSEREARVFFILSRLSSANAAQVGNSARLSRLQTYRALKGLLDRGLVEMSLERPRRYTPLKIGQAISLLEQEAEQKMLDLENKKPLLLKEWSEITDFGIDRTNYTFRIIQGKRNVLKFAMMLYESAETEIATIMKGEDLTRWILEGADDVLQKQTDRNILLKSLSEVSERNTEATKRFLEFSGLRHTDQPNLVPLTIVDDREVLIGLHGDNRDGSNGLSENAIWTNHPDLVATLKGFFNMLWEKSKDGISRIRELEQVVQPDSIG